MTIAPSPTPKPVLPGATPAPVDATLRIGPPKPAEATGIAGLPFEVFPFPTQTPAPVRELNIARSPEIAGYVIEGVLGRGGMGIVYRARQEKLNRHVALKMLRHEDVASLSDALRFRGEAESVAAVRHPNIVQVFDCGLSDGRPYFAMEYLSGGSLFNLIRAGAPLEADSSATLLVKLASAVHAAHSQGIVHRDLKPSNVLFDGQDEPKITDFGLAKRTSQELTRTQVIMGTPAYMAPEQASGQAKFAGPPADIYALGVILYECLTGKTPFHSDDPILLIDQVIRDAPPPPRSRVASIPRDLELICLKCLEKDPRERYATGEELAADLERFLAREPVSVRPSGPFDRGMKWARRRPTLAAAYGLALLALFLIGFGGGVVALWIQANRSRDELAHQKREVEVARDNEAAERRRAEVARDELDSKKAEVELALGRESEAHAAAQKAKNELERTRYFRNVAFAHKELIGGNFLRAVSLLNECPESRRGWEWHHVHSLAHPEFGSGATAEMPFDAAFIPGSNDVQVGIGSGKYSRFNFQKTDRTDVELAPLGGQTHLAARGHRAIVALDRHGNSQVSRVSVFDLDSGRELAFWEDESDFALLWDLSGDGRRCLIHFPKKPLRVYDVETGKQIAEIPADIPDFKALSLDVRARFDEAGTTVVVPTKSGLLVWDLTDPKATRRLPLGGGTPSAAGVAPDGKTVVGGSSRGALHLYPPGAEKPIVRVKAHRGEIGIIAFSPDGKEFATAGEDGTVRVWNAANCDPLREFNGHTGQIVGLNFNANGELLAAVDQTKIFRVWPVRFERPAVVKVQLPPKYNALFASDFSGKRYFADDGKGTARVWENGKSGPGEEILAPPGERFTAAAFQAQSNRYAVGTDACAVFYRKDLRDRPYHVGVLKEAVHTIRISDDGKWLAAASDTSLGLWNLETGKMLQSLETEVAPRCLAFSPDSRKLVIAWKSTIALVPLSGERIVRMTVEDEASCVGFTPDSKDVVVGTRNWGLKIYDVAWPKENGAQCKGLYIGHTAAVTAFAYHPNGLRLATGAADGTLKVWDVESQNETIGLSTYSRETVSACGFTADGNRLIAVVENSAPTYFEARPGHAPLLPAALRAANPK